MGRYTRLSLCVSVRHEPYPLLIAVSRHRGLFRGFVRDAP